MKIGDTKRIGGATLKIKEFCDEPNTGLLLVMHTRDGNPWRSWYFMIPCEWWDAMRCDSADPCFHPYARLFAETWDAWAKEVESFQATGSWREGPTPGVELKCWPSYNGRCDHPVGWWVTAELGPDELEDEGDDA